VCSEPPAAQLGQLPRDDFRLRDSILKRGFGGQRFRGPVMDLQLLGKTALVTGASMGIGRAMAKALAAEGVQVAVVARCTHLLEEFASEIGRGQGPRPLPIVHDIMARDAAPRLRDAALAGLGHIDILVNCAGGSRPLSVDAPRKNGKKRSGSLSTRSPPGRIMSEQIRRNYPEEYRNSHAAA
jgi:NAD(P)-dependent dehydrogenase (short-subunit alcohol dehydrogenase family)